MSLDPDECEGSGGEEGLCGFCVRQEGADGSQSARWGSSSGLHCLLNADITVAETARGLSHVFRQETHIFEYGFKWLTHAEQERRLEQLDEVEENAAEKRRARRFYVYMIEFF